MSEKNYLTNYEDTGKDKLKINGNIKKEFEYLVSISDELEAGKWYAIVYKDFIKGTTAKEVYKKIRAKYPSCEPFIIKIPVDSIIL